MKKMTLLTILFLSLFNAFSQEKAKFEFNKKTNTTFEGTTPLFTIEKAHGSGIGNNLSFKNMEGQELFVLKFSEFSTPSESTKSNPSGRIIFMEFIFSNTSSTCEVAGGFSLKHYAKMVYDNKLIVNGQLDPVAEERFIKVTGNDFSRKRIAGNTINIIIENNNNPAPRNGVNINSGH